MTPSFWSAVAWACGGADFVGLDEPLRPPEQHVNRWLYAWDGYESVDQPVTRFLYALHDTDPHYAALEDALHLDRLRPGEPVFPDEPELGDLLDALRVGDRARAHEVAAALAELQLDLPAPLAESTAEDYRVVVEFLELEPLLGELNPAQLSAWFLDGDTSTPLGKASAQVRGLDPAAAAALLAKAPNHPRRASLRWLKLRHDLKTQVPDGWDAEEIARATPAEVRSGLLAEADAWLADFPDHPLADQVRLAKVRLHHLTGFDDDAFRELLGMVDRHPVRVAEELRFLLRTGATPPMLDPATLPPAFAGALWPFLVTDDEDWAALWRRTEAEPEAPWAVPVQERLLLAVQGRQRLPASFPGFDAQATTTSGLLRLGALAAADRRDEAWQQSEALLATQLPAVAHVRAWILLTRGDWVRAVREPFLSADSRSYLLRVLAPEAVLRQLARDPELGEEASFSLALRLRAGGDWKAGTALLKRTDPERAALWREAAALDRKAGSEARLAYADWMRAHAGRVFLGRDYGEVVWYRSLPITRPPEGDLPSGRAPGLPFTPDQEWEAIVGWLTRSFASYEALTAYAEALEDPPEGEVKAAIVSDADILYNALLNYGSSDHYAWGAIVRDCDAAKAVRRAGRE